MMLTSLLVFVLGLGSSCSLLAATPPCGRLATVVEAASMAIAAIEASPR
jgi:hypothetical protein